MAPILNGLPHFVVRSIFIVLGGMRQSLVRRSWMRVGCISKYRSKRRVNAAAKREFFGRGDKIGA